MSKYVTLQPRKFSVEFRDSQAANTATARKLACMVYHLLKYKEDYIDVDCLIYQENIRKSRIVKLCKQAEELGFEMIKKAA